MSLGFANGNHSRHCSRFFDRRASVLSREYSPLRSHYECTNRRIEERCYEPDNRVLEYLKQRFFAHVKNNTVFPPFSIPTRNSIHFAHTVVKRGLELFFDSRSVSLFCLPIDRFYFLRSREALPRVLFRRSRRSLVRICFTPCSY